MQFIKILLFHIYIKLNMFRATHRPSSGAQKLHWKPLVFHRCKVVGPVVGGRCHAQYILRLTRSTNHRSNNLPRMENRRLPIQF